MKYLVLPGVVAIYFLLAGYALGAQSHGRWEKLGERHVDFKSDRDRIDVGRSEGKFRQIRINVKDAPIEMYNMIVTFENGKPFSPNLRHRFAEGSNSRVIDLPGERRFIKSVSFRYRSIKKREGRGTVELWAR